MRSASSVSPRTSVAAGSTTSIWSRFSNPCTRAETPRLPAASGTLPVAASAAGGGTGSCTSRSFTSPPRQAPRPGWRSARRQPTPGASSALAIRPWPPARSPRRRGACPRLPPRQRRPVQLPRLAGLSRETLRAAQQILAGGLQQRAVVGSAQRQPSRQLEQPARVDGGGLAIAAAQRHPHQYLQGGALQLV